MNQFLAGLKTTFATRNYRVGGFIIFCIALLAYLMTLPASFTGGRIGPSALQFLDSQLVLFSLVMAILVAFLLPVMVYLVRLGRGASKSSATGGAVVGVLTPVLCCSPILPIALGFLATFFPSLASAIGWKLQGFIATHQTELFVAAPLLLLFALWQNARRIEAGFNCAVAPQGQP